MTAEQDSILVEYLKYCFYEDFADSEAEAESLANLMKDNWDKVFGKDDAEYYKIFGERFESVRTCVNLLVNNMFFKVTFKELTKS